MVLKARFSFLLPCYVYPIIYIFIFSGFIEI